MGALSTVFGLLDICAARRATLGVMETPSERIERIRAALLFRDRMRDEGRHDRELGEAVRQGALVRITRGAYVARDIWDAWFPDDTHIARALALDHAARARKPVFSHVTAAVILGLPGYQMRRERLHITTPRTRHSRDTRRVAHHIGALADHETTEVTGLRCTAIDRTLADVMLTARPDQGVICLDAGLRELFGPSVGEQQGEWRAERLESLKSKCGLRGVQTARRLAAFADGRSDSPAESLSRLQLARLGYRFEIQVEIPTSAGLFRADFEFTGLGVLGEVDGEIKYRDPEILGGKTAGDAVIEEKHREDLVSGTHRARFVRWGFNHAHRATTLGARLRSFGVYPQG